MAYTTSRSSSSSSLDSKSLEERLVFYKKIEDVLIDKINVLNLDVELRDKVLAEYKKDLEKAEKERDELKLILEKLENSSKSLNALLESQVSDKDKTGLGYKAASPAVEGFVNSSKILETQENQSDKGYHEVPPPFIGNYMPPKRDLMLIDEHFESESVDVSTVSSSDGKTVKIVDVKGVVSKEEPKPVKKNSFSLPIIEDWVSESEEENKPKFQKQVQPSFPKIMFFKAKDQNQYFRKLVKQVEQAKSNIHRPRGNQRNWNNLMNQRLGSNFEFKNTACYECGIFDHLIKDCCVHQKKDGKNSVEQCKESESSKY
uniref:Ubiquitin hydrolase n=1 Tax=Tanacetum cinerariifolium TaxID=118510 RepID=A0A6L2J0T7_TANCI|nr:ubiquitin hydrolase [Tanacetum cinerariifolium]